MNKKRIINDENIVDISSRLEMFSNKFITLDGCKYVIDCRTEYIKLKIKKGTLSIIGQNMNIDYYENNSIKISGTINSIEFCVGGEKA